MTEKRFTYIKNSSISQYQSIPIQKIGKGKAFHCQGVVDELNKLWNENEQLKQCLNEAKNDEKQLSIDFMGFKMKLIEQLQIHYDYANEQRQKNLDNPLLAKAYDIIRYDVRKLAEEMGVDLE